VGFFTSFKPVNELQSASEQGQELLDMDTEDATKMDAATKQQSEECD
jgi:hypothetical protein